MVLSALADDFALAQLVPIDPTTSNQEFVLAVKVPLIHDVVATPLT